MPADSLLPMGLPERPSLHGTSAEDVARIAPIWHLSLLNILSWRKLKEDPLTLALPSSKRPYKPELLSPLLPRSGLRKATQSLRFLLTPLETGLWQLSFARPKSEEKSHKGTKKELDKQTSPTSPSTSPYSHIPCLPRQTSVWSSIKIHIFPWSWMSIFMKVSESWTTRS